MNYRYAFQGQELDTETSMEAFQLRLWDGRIGRWLNPDPYGQHDSPYAGMGNNPVSHIDNDGGYETALGAFFGWVGHGFKGSIEHTGGEGNHNYSILLKKGGVINDGIGNRLNTVVADLRIYGKSSSSSNWLADNISYTHTLQEGKKDKFNSGVGDQLKLKIYIGVRVGEQKMFDINDTSFLEPGAEVSDEGRNYQLSIMRHSLNFRPKDYRIRFMTPIDKNRSSGVSLGQDGIGYHYNVNNGNGRSGGLDVAFRPGGYTALLIAGAVLSILEPAAAPEVAATVEEIGVHLVPAFN